MASADHVAVLPLQRLLPNCRSLSQLPNFPSCLSSFRPADFPHSSQLFPIIAMSSPKQRPDQISFGDRLLDYIEGGPKLRKWYGAPNQLPKDIKENELYEQASEEQVQEENEPRDAILVTNGDSMIGQLVLLSLILKRTRIRALVKDAKEIVTAFGSYVEPVLGDVEDQKSLRNALKGVRAVVCLVKVGALADKEILRGIEHIVFLSQLEVFNRSSGLASLFNAKSRRQAVDDEAALKTLGLPCTIVRSAVLKDEPGGQQGFIFKEGSASKGTISSEDAAMICVKALDVPPKNVIIFEVANGEGQVDDWNSFFQSLNGC